MRGYRLLGLFIVFVILFSSAGVLAEDNNPDFIMGKTEGASAGLVEGEDVGELDAKNKSNTKNTELLKRLLDWEIKLTSLNKSEDYKTGFKEGFEVSFEEGYIKGYKSISSEEDKESITIYGAEDFGSIMGRIDGFAAYRSGKKNDWQRFVPSDRKIRDMFELNKELREYEIGFIEGFKKAYKEAFEASYQVGKLGEKDYSYEQGLKDGDQYAKDIAALNGQKDYFLGLSNDYKRNMPSNREIISMFNLNNESKEYQDAFLVGFEFGTSSGSKISGGYMLYYINAYRQANKEFIETTDLNGEEGGMSIGSMKGEYAAIIDITLMKQNSWISHKVNDEIIINEYGLQFQSENYRNAFIIGYWDGFMKSYNETYKKLQQIGRASCRERV